MSIDPSQERLMKSCANILGMRRYQFAMMLVPITLTFDGYLYICFVPWILHCFYMIYFEYTINISNLLFTPCLLLCLISICNLTTNCFMNVMLLGEANNEIERLRRLMK